MTANGVINEGSLSIVEIPIVEAGNASNSIAWAQCRSTGRARLRSTAIKSHFALLAGLGSSAAKACVVGLLVGIVGGYCCPRREQLVELQD